MIKLLVKAHRWWAQLQRGDITIRELAEAEGVVKSYVTRVRAAGVSSRRPSSMMCWPGGRSPQSMQSGWHFTADLPTSWHEQLTHLKSDGRT